MKKFNKKVGSLLYKELSKARVDSAIIDKSDTYPIPVIRGICLDVAIFTGSSIDAVIELNKKWNKCHQMDEWIY